MYLGHLEENLFQISLPLGCIYKDSLYNVYVNPTREDGYGVSFVKSCLNSVRYDIVKLYCDDWNVRAQSFFEKVGFTKI